jgi:hypothetical protein
MICTTDKSNSYLLHYCAIVLQGELSLQGELIFLESVPLCRFNCVISFVILSFERRALREVIETIAFYHTHALVLILVTDQ